MCFAYEQLGLFDWLVRKGLPGTRAKKVGPEGPEGGVAKTLFVNLHI